MGRFEGGIEELELMDDLLCVEPWDEEGVTEGGIYLDHVWEDVAGHAFGVVVAKAGTGSPLLADISLGDKVLFTRSAHMKVNLQWAGQDTDLLLVNVNDVIAILTEEGGPSQEQDSVDGANIT